MSAVLPQDETSEVAQLRAALERSQQQLRDMALAQEEFLRAVSHDLRAPLRHFTSFTGLVREVLGELPVPVQQGDAVQEALGFLQTMDQSARRMAAMIDGLQALSQAARAPLRLQPVALESAVQQAWQVHAASHAGRSVAWQVAPGLPQVWADPDLLHTLLVQLLGNALKFTGPVAQPQVMISAQALQPEGAGSDVGARVRWAVRDNGVGFDPARAAGLFGVFQRLHRESEFEGVGAGLALCRAVAQRHGAEIAATAAPQGGCTVELCWPLAR